MACGTPVITSKMEPHREVAGGAAALIDPYDAASMSEKIVEILNSPDYRQALIAGGQRRAAEFSWEKTAAITLEILQDAGRVS
jgi:glycosyltransferase involved in cell wall biosynthesis